MQTGSVFLGNTYVSIELPEADADVIDGVKWGVIEAFPSLAYWTYQVMCRRIEGKVINFKLGSSLKEEVGACLLGGHGIPASIGIAAFESLKKYGAFGEALPSEADLLQWLSEPLAVNGRLVRYRFARQKARYIAVALKTLHAENPPLDTGRALRDWLLALPGIGYKTASWIARNALSADDVAILDIHLYRAGVLGGFFDPALTVEKNYRELEEIFINVSNGLGIRASELDAVIWYEMMTSPATVHGLLSSTGIFFAPAKAKTLNARTNKRHPNTDQLALVV